MKLNEKTKQLYKLGLLSATLSFATSITARTNHDTNSHANETKLELSSTVSENDNNCGLPPVVRNHRIAYVADGNSPDPDDIGATAASIALMRAVGLEHKLVYCAHSCDLDPFRNPGRQVINATQEANRQVILQETCDGTAARWGGFDNLTFYNCRTQETTAINKLTEAINASTSTDRLAIILAGEPDVIYDAIDAADSDKRQYVSIVSHHVANEESADTPGKNISNVRVDFPTVQVTRISDQNEELQTPFSAWDWARDHQDSRINWLWEQGRIAEQDTVVGFQAGKFDISDAGMLYYQLFDKDQPTVTDFRNIFECFVEEENTISNNAPTVNITSPLDGAVFVVGTPIALQATASDLDGNLNKVNFKINDRFYKTDSTQPYQNSFTPTQPGNYKIAARAFDSEGLSKEVFVTITVEAAPPTNSAPEVTITSPANGAVFTVGETIELKADASDLDGNLNKVNFKLNDRFYKTDSSQPYQNSFTTSQPGTYKIAARAFDSEGLSKEVFVTITVEAAAPTNSAPQVTITSPANGGVFTVGETIEIKADASDLDGNLNKVNFKLNDRFYKTDRSRPFQNSFTPTQTGTYKIAARAFDDEGLSKEVFVNITVESSRSLKGLTTNEEENELKAIDIYPVPASEILNISGLTSNYSNIRISDVSGKIVMQHNTQKSNPIIHIDSLTNGLYFILIEDGTKQKTIRFIKK